MLYFSLPISFSSPFDPSLLISSYLFLSSLFVSNLAPLFILTSSTLHYSHLLCSTPLFFNLSFSCPLLSSLLMFPILIYSCLLPFLFSSISSGCKLYYEQHTHSLPEDSPSYKLFLSLKNKVTIRVNKPPLETYDYPLAIDVRWSVRQLREMIEKEIGLPGEELRLFKGW